MQSTSTCSLQAVKIAWNLTSGLRKTSFAIASGTGSYYTQYWKSANSSELSLSGTVSGTKSDKHKNARPEKGKKP